MAEAVEEATADNGDNRSERVDDQRVPSPVDQQQGRLRLVPLQVPTLQYLRFHPPLPPRPSPAKTDFKILQHRDKARRIHLLEYFVSTCHEIGVSCEAMDQKGGPKEIICHEVKRVQPDFLELEAGVLDLSKGFLLGL